MSTPRNREDIRCLCYSLHVRHIVTLTEEEPLPPSWFEGLPSIKNTLLPVANYRAPSIEQIDIFMRLCSSPVKAPVLVHCGGGKGRAGTMIACYLVAFGFRPPPLELYSDSFQPAMSAAVAIEALRSMRPGSIETKEQEEALDGANMGISLSAEGAIVVQNRSHVVNAQTHRQFRALDDFLNSHRAVLDAILNRDPLFPGRFILYGEWLAATHSIPYSRLGSLFYAFDLYDRESGQFWDRSSLQELLETSAASNDAPAASSAPTTSTVLADATAAVDDAVDDVKIDLSAVGAEDAKVLTIADVLNAREQELMTNKGLMDFEEWESISGTETVDEAVALMAERNIGSLIVTEEKEGIVGIVTERDVVKKISPRTVMSEEKLVHDVMSSHIMCIHPNTTVIDALATMTKENIRHLAVVNGDMTSAVKRGSVQEEDMRCVLSITDIVRAYAEFEAAKNTVVSSEPVTEEAPSIEAKKSEEDKGVKTADAAAEPTKTDTTEATAAPIVTAASLLKKKHKRIKLILNTRPEDNVTVAQAVEEMANRDFGAVLVVDKEQRVLGIFTERDYIRKVLFEHKDPMQLLVTDVMSSVGSVLQIEDPLEKCWDLAATSNCRHFPVIGVMRKDREKELAGILSIKDIVREISKDHHATPGFRLMEFLKSKMEPKPVEPKPEPKVEPASEPKAEPATESKPEVAAAPTEDKNSNKTTAPVVATASLAKEPKTEAPTTEAKKIVEEPATPAKQ
ncbi:hypothetical protein BBP00_00007600 [Phytophthora kernoviae]|uniref:Tyrosine specific protein phosphatases domain-containing protein n=1 Tax=Phytophthora kernoviae TaxID=325452 RepID=A0A3F2RIC5_9STRA|nr:hypothetical protein BBP00_00007600 [Phytophthora kernoviae]